MEKEGGTGREEVRQWKKRTEKDKGKVELRRDDDQK